MPHGRALSRVLNRRFTAGLGATVLATSLALPFSHGSAGIGDSLYPDYGNGGYDVGHYNIHVTYHPKSKKLVGTTTITATATQHLTRFDLDFVLTARHVTVNGQTAKFTQHLVTKPHDNYGGELVVTPKTALHKGSALKIVVTYDGRPGKRLVNGFTPWVTTTTGAVALGEPEAAAWWFPSNDHPRDKATYDITMHMPKGLQGIANGVLVSHTTKGTGTTWHWRESQPMATYLAFAAVGSYTLTTTHSHGRPVYTAIAKKVGRFGPAATKDVKRTAEVVDWESSLFGPYPFNAEGAVVPDGTFLYALENQTRPVYDRVFWDEGTAMYVVAHENAHEWFGDSVSVDQWKDIWLNEGFATYAEWLWSEHAGEGSAESLFESFYDLFPASNDFWHTAIANPTIPQTFEDPVYDRGGMTLGALRNRIGDTDFFDLLRQWAALHKNGTATTPEFIALAEQVSGQDLTSFFTAWLSTRSKPAATVANGFPPAAGAALHAGAGSGRVRTGESAPASLPDLLRTQALLTRGLHRP